MNEKRLLGSWLIASIFIIVFGGHQLFVQIKANDQLQSSYDKQVVVNEKLKSDYDKQIQVNQSLLADIADRDKTIKRLDSYLQDNVDVVREITKEAVKTGWTAKAQGKMTLKEILSRIDGS